MHLKYKFSSKFHFSHLTGVILAYNFKRKHTMSAFYWVIPDRQRSGTCMSFLDHVDEMKISPTNFRSQFCAMCHKSKACNQLVN